MACTLTLVKVSLTLYPKLHDTPQHFLPLFSALFLTTPLLAIYHVPYFTDLYYYFVCTPTPTPVPKMHDRDFTVTFLIYCFNLS